MGPTCRAHRQITVLDIIIILYLTHLPHQSLLAWFLNIIVKHVVFFVVLKDDVLYLDACAWHPRVRVLIVVSAHHWDRLFQLIKLICWASRRLDDRRDLYDCFGGDNSRLEVCFNLINPTWVYIKLSGHVLAKIIVVILRKHLRVIFMVVWVLGIMLEILHIASRHHISWKLR